MKRVIATAVLVLTVCCAGAYAQESSADKEREAIKQTALDYVEGWYEANSERMQRALHPELA